MSEEITNARLNIVSGEAFLEHFNDARPGGLEHFWLSGDYGDVFRQLRGGAGHTRFALPWREGQRSSFWRAYCEQTPISQISTDLAFRLMVPLRLVPNPRPSVKIANGSERIFYDVYGFPHGLVAALTIQTAAGATLSIDQWRDRMRDLRLNARYSVDLPGIKPETDLRAQDVFDRLILWHRESYFGSINVATPSETPFSIVTVVQGTGVDPSIPLSSLPDLQKTLNAIAAWPVNWQAAAVPPLADAVLLASSINASPGDALFATRRGRVLWRPALFIYPTTAGTRLHSLSCLAHNLLAASVQAESLRLFAIRFAAIPVAERELIPPLLRHRAATLIGRLWRGDQTYRSASVKRLLGDAGSLAQVNALLAAEQIPPIG